LAGDGAFGVALKDITLACAPAKIVAIAGVAGNGQGEFFDAISGERPVAAGMVLLDGGPLGGGVNHGATQGSVPPSCRRNGSGHGAVPGHDPVQNVFLSRHAVRPRWSASGC
jgi:ABC-type uncharacterized transport system ATPase subunit